MLYCLDMDKKVITVLGRCSPDKMGITDAHSHIWIAPQEVPIPGAPVLDEQEAIINELTAYRQKGGGAQVDCQPGGAGRDAQKLSLISRQSKVKIVACTGFHLEKYYQENNRIWKMNSNQAADYFLSEIKDGLDGQEQKETIYPGFIKIAVNKSLEESPKQLLEAAIAVSNETGYLIEMHTEKGAGIEEFINYFDALGLDPDRLVICHIDKRPDPELHKELARSGYLLEYDTFFRPKYSPEKNLWPLIFDMVESGFDSSLALATDQADPEMWQITGHGPGLSGFIEIVKSRLDQVIKSPNIVDNLLGRNISTRLAVH